MTRFSRPLLSLPVLLAACTAIDDGGPAGAVDGFPFEADPGEWVTHGRDYGETRFSPLATIDASNVSELGLAWSYATETDRGLEATPLVVDGTMYTTGSWSVVYALDARTGEERWRWDPMVDRSYGQRACCDVVNRGAAFYEGKVFVGILDGRLAALDAATGTPIWEVVTVDQSLPYTITGAPRVVKGRVVIGNGGAEYGVRGYISAYDAETGDLAWRTYTVPGNPADGFESEAMEEAAETWTGTWWEYGGGGTVWDSFAYDEELELLYAGTGNGSPWNQEIRSPEGGDNLYLSSILALDPDDGEIVWHYQTTPGETWDFTAVQHMILADLEIDGEIREVLMQAPKNGFFYVLDRGTGELISAEPYVPVTWATHVDLETGRPVEVPSARYVESPANVSPGPLGGHNWHPMSYNPQTGLVYIPAQENWFGYGQPPEFEFRAEVWNTGVQFGAAGPVPAAPLGHLLAWDPVAQEERWRVPYTDMWNGGTLTTAGTLVFQGTSDGRFVAYNAVSGEKLWEVSLGGGVIAAPMTYELDGIQYVSIMAGWGGSYGVTGGGRGLPRTPGRLYTFTLSGSAALPGAPAPADRPAPTPIPVDASPEVIAAGATTYNQFCSVCHGAQAVSGGVLPDLRYSTPETLADLEGIVLGGGRSDRGMPSFAQVLSGADVAAVRAYILSRRAELQ
jgi:PQQ-dependent dehydrogenase (methanol/ethanol family)